jgi:hypothetical protein
MAAAPSIEALAIGSESVLNIDELLKGAAYAHAVSDIKLHETHISWVILTGEYAYKVKKRVKLEFPDTTTLATRHFLCNEELRLNKRLAPDLYLEVVPITQDHEGIKLGGTGTVIDYAVKMKQFGPSQELPALLVRADVTAQEITRLAERLAEFHRRAALPPDDAGFDYVAQLRNSVLGNVAALLAHLSSQQELPAMGQLIDWTHDSLQDLHECFRERQSRGYIRECHGDLHAHNIVRWQGQLTPFDCLEFDPNLRWIDVMNDVAFLVMDLVGHDRKDLAYEFLSRYVEKTGDYAGIRLLPFYAVYRALVRAMVDTLSGEQKPAERLEMNGRLHGRISTALDFMHPKRPSLIIMHGPSGSGKSWMSERLVPLVAAVRLRRQTYAHILECAESCLLGGVSVIVDAAFSDADDRERFRSLAQRRGASFVILSCIADKSEMARRIVGRAQGNADPSEATIAVLDNQLQSFVPLRADELEYVIRVDTLQPDPQRAAFAMLQAREVNLRVRQVAWQRRRDLMSPAASLANPASHRH